MSAEQVAVVGSAPASATSVAEEQQRSGNVSAVGSAGM